MLDGLEMLKIILTFAKYNQECLVSHNKNMSMKTITCLITAILLALPFCCNAQEEMFPTGMTWEEIYVEDDVIRDGKIVTDTLGFRKYEICGDTIIGQKTYKKVMCDGKSYGACIREADNCVWMKADIYPEEFKLYDFNWDGKENITVQLLRWNDFYRTGVSLIEGIMWLNMGRGTLTTDEGVKECLRQCAVIVRGLGNVEDMDRNSSLLGYTIPETIMPDLVYWKVFWIRKNGVIVYHDSAYNVAGITTQQTKQQQPASTAYDLQGRRVSPHTSSLSPLKKGIYIENGRKRVVSR